MGRKAGHLELGIGKSAGATLTIIPEEFPENTLTLSRVVDTIVGGIIKRRAEGRQDGVAVVAGRGPRHRAGTRIARPRRA